MKKIILLISVLGICNFSYASPKCIKEMSGLKKNLKVANEEVSLTMGNYSNATLFIRSTGARHNYWVLGTHAQLHTGYAEQYLKIQNDHIKAFFAHKTTIGNNEKIIWNNIKALEACVLRK